jgi:hypothetical protein
MFDMIGHQQELFSIFDEFFRQATGTTAEKFASLDKFAEKVPTLTRRIDKVKWAFESGIPRLSEFYSRHKTKPFGAAQKQGGIKAVLGGGSRFRTSQLNATRRLVLYADTVLVPDPVFAWIETERLEERFRHVQLLQEMFFLLHLKPLVDSKCEIPPLFVFPSYEKLLVKHDSVTRDALSQFISGTLSQILGQRFMSISDVTDFATHFEKEFLEGVARTKLFVAPGGPLDEPLEAAIERYLNEVSTWRSKEHLEQLRSLSTSQLVCNAIFERLGPQYHLAENANELRAQPLLSVEQQTYYFRVCASATEDFLQKQDAISAATRATIDALGQQEFAWLTPSNTDALIEMRLNNENERFREQLSKATSILNEASLSNLDRVASEVSRGIGSLINEHRSEARKIAEKYRSKYSGLATKGWLSVGASLIPHLAPLIAAIPGLTLGGEYAQAKMEELREKRELSLSLIGILAAAKNSAD